MILIPEPLTAEAFAPYGDVIESSDSAETQKINYGHTLRFHNLAELDLTEQNGKALVNIFRTTPMALPIKIEIMERHPLSSQTIFPLGDNPYLVVVAEKGDFNENKIMAFIASPSQGVNYHRGTWHHYSLALNDVSEFLAIDRCAEDKNCDEVTLGTPITIQL
jgi:ureidoglycolate lyase